jgi:hypothetical protein
MRYLLWIRKSGLFREIFLCLAVSVFVFACALAWGGPFLLGVSSGAAVHGQQRVTQSGTFTGTVVRNGEQFGLRETSGRIYRLDDSQHAETFEGKQVTVTGTLDIHVDLIHVAQIQFATA